MRKTKILAVFGILLAMGITACNKSSTNKSSSSEEHTHSFGSWTEVTPATCTEKGSKERVCACGEKETGEIPALGHDFENGTVTADTSTCTADGKQTVKCSRCDATQQVDVKAHHKFGAETKVDKTGTADVDYYTATCSVDQALQIRFPTEVGGVYSGTTRKSGTPDGYTKLTGNGSISWTINVAGTKGYMGKMYHKACMDAFPSNKEKNYQYYDSRSSNVRDSGNFNFYVNGQLTDKSAYMDISFDDLTKDGEVDPALAEITDSPGPYSPVALCPLADNVYIQPGTNVFKYERTGSYNMVMSDLVFIGTEYVHAHNNNTTDFASDENQHWNVCTAVGCPSNGKVNVANHTFEEVAPADDAETDVEHKARAATCSEEGIKVEVCSVCQYRKESPINKLPHTFAEDGGWTVNTPASCTAAGERQHQCTVCEEIVKEAIPALGHDFGEAVANYAAVTEGDNKHIAATAHNCSRCDISSLDWSALDYDEAKTTAASDKAPKSADNGKAVQFDTSVTQGMGEDHSGKGTHLVYVVDVPEAVENAGLAMYASQAPYSADMFDQMTNENSRGSYQNAEGEWVTPDSRYGIKVDGVEYMVAKNNGAIKGAGTAWYQFPGISLTLTAGIHEFEFFKYGGYDVNNYEFRLIGLPHVIPAHTHNGDATWVTDASNHWHVCTGEGCPLPEGGIYGKAAHDKNGTPENADVPATCLEEGKDYWKCSVCGYESFDPIAKLAHNDSQLMVKANADGKNVVLSECSVGGEKAITMASKDISGAKAFSRTSADLAEPEVFELGDAKNVSGADSYKLDKGTAIFWKINVNKAITGAKLEIGAKYSNSGSRCFGNHHDYSDSNTNGDKDSESEWRIYASVDGVNFLHPNYEKTTLINSKLDSSAGKFADFGTVNLVEGENIIYAVQPNIGYRIEFTGGIRISYTGDAVITGEEPAHEHNWSAGAADTNGISALTCSGCELTGLEFNGMANNAIGSNAAAVSDGKLNKGVTLAWNVNMPEAGTVEIWLSAKYSANNGDKAFASGWAVQVGDTAGTLTLDTTARADSLLSQNNYKWFKVGEVTITAAGEAVIKVTTYGSSAQARLLVDNAANNARLIYK